MQKIFYAIALMGTLFWASSLSMDGKKPALDIPDKWAHFLLYGLLATLYLRHPSFLNKCRRGILLAVLAASLYGASDEFHQKFVEDRVAELADWIADTMGALFAAWLYHSWTAYRKLLEFSLFQKKKGTHKNS